LFPSGKEKIHECKEYYKKYNIKKCINIKKRDKNSFMNSGKLVTKYFVKVRYLQGIISIYIDLKTINSLLL
jgi:hypothetical protein